MAPAPVAPAYAPLCIGGDYAKSYAVKFKQRMEDPYENPETRSVLQMSADPLPVDAQCVGYAWQCDLESGGGDAGTKRQVKKEISPNTR